MATWAEIRRIPGTDFGAVIAIGTGSKLPGRAHPNYLIVDLAGVTPVPAVDWFYTPETDTFSQTPPGTIPKDSVTPENLWFTRVQDTERGRIWALGQEDGGGVTLNQVQRGRLKAYLAFSAANPIDLEGAETVFIFNAMETAGAIDPGRAAEILA